MGASNSRCVLPHTSNRARRQARRLPRPALLTHLQPHAAVGSKPDHGELSSCCAASVCVSSCMQIPWGRWRGGPLVVELSDVVLCVAPREESDWEEGPALRRAQAAKQAQLAAAELAKLGSRVAATGSSSGGGSAKPAAAAPAAAAAGAGSGTSWGWVIADYVLSFLLNRLQFAVKNIHVYFQVSSAQLLCVWGPRFMRAVFAVSALRDSACRPKTSRARVCAPGPELRARSCWRWLCLHAGA